MNVEKVTLVFSTRKGFASWLIRKVTWSRWSHVAILVDPGHLIDSTFTHRGVKLRTVTEALKDAADYTYVDFYVPSAAAVRMVARDELDKPYDWTALFGLWLKRDWQEPDSWFCSELVAYCFERAGCPLFRDGTTSRITPRDLWFIDPRATHGWQRGK